MHFSIFIIISDTRYQYIVLYIEIYDHCSDICCEVI